MLLPLADIQIWGTFAIIATVIVIFAIDRVPIELTAIGAVVALLLFFQVFPVDDGAGRNLLDAEGLLQGFANPVLFTILALLVIGRGLFQTGADEAPARMITRLSRRRPRTALTATLLGAGSASAFLNNTPVVVIFIPIIGAIARRIGYSLSRVMMPLSFITILGGTTTLIGSSANLVAVAMAEKAGMSKVGFFDFFVPGLLAALLGAVYVLFVLPRIMPARMADIDYKSEFSGRQFLAQIALTKGHPWIGARAVAGLFPALKTMTPRMVHRSGRLLPRPFDDIELREGDVISVIATREALAAAITDARESIGIDVGLADGTDGGTGKGADDGRRRRTDLTMAEAVVAPQSRLKGVRYDQAGDFTGTDCKIIGVQRRQRMLRVPLHRIRLEPGDELLLLGSDASIKALRRSSDLLLLEWSAAELPRTLLANTALLTFGITILFAASGMVPIPVAAIAGAVAMIGFGCLNVHQAIRAIDARIFLMIGAAFALAEAMRATGGAAFLASTVVEGFAGYGPAVLLSALFLLTAILTNFLSNQATGALMAPVAVAAAAQIGADPTPFVHGLIIALNCSFATPMAYQTNLLVMGPGHYRFADFVLGGLPLILLIWVFFSLFAPAYYGL
ncbi:MAG: SLC13 family permease [Hyphomicrobiales bacterium]|nr:SLC13 family permease [Hyphomicrobiales bacterium]